MSSANRFIYNYYEKCRFIYTGKNLPLPEYLKMEINNYWNYLKSEGKSFNNGEIFTISDIKLNQGYLDFIISKTNFAHYLYSLKQKSLGDFTCRSIASNALILTSDNYYVMGSMSGNTSLPYKIKFIGGAISTDDLLNNSFDPRSCVIREVKEEIGISLTNKDVIDNFKPIYYLTRENLSFINVLFLAQLKMTSGELKIAFEIYKKKLQTHNIDSELADIYFLKCNKEAITMFLENNQNILIDYMDDLFRVIVGKYDAKNILEEI